MKIRLPKNLGPRAKREALLGLEGQMVLCEVELASSASRSALDANLQSLGVEVRSWNESARLLTIALPATKLIDLAALDKVVYVEVAQPYTQ
jgi:hypothetical protein